ncbi:hypothetical protein IJT93_02435 [bacterium]|nr:hypothetical protein [bacterium]
MPCKIIDVHSYGKCEIKPKFPKEPMCLPVEVHKKLILKKIALIASIYVILPAYFFIGSGRLTVNEFTVTDILVTVAVIGAVIYSVIKVQKNTYARLQDPMHNPRGCRYQGRVLSEDDAHYQLHLDYYKTHGTWTLPDGFEPGAE